MRTEKKKQKKIGKINTNEPVIKKLSTPKTTQAQDKPKLQKQQTRKINYCGNKRNL